MQKPGKWDDEKLIRILSGKEGLDARARTALSALERPFSALIIVHAESYNEMRNAIVSEISKNSEKIVYISVNAAYNKISKEFAAERIQTKGTHFIDMISAEASIKQETSENVSYVESPTELAECILSVEKQLAEAKGKATIVLLDSVSTLLVYNDAASIQKFIHSLIGKVSSAGGSTAIISSDSEEGSGVIKTLAQFVDKTLKV